MYRKRRYVTFRLLEKEKKLLQDLGRGREDVSDRYEAFCELARLLDEMKFADVKKQKRKPFRIGVPEILDDKISKIAKKTGRTYISILLAAAQKYRERYPME